MDASLHVTHVVLSLDFGGLERVVLELIREGRALGQRVSVVCLERPGTLARKAAELGGEVVCVDKPPGLRPSTVRRLRDAFYNLGTQVVHTHQVGALFYAGLAARMAGIKTVVHTEHGKHYESQGRRRWLARISARYADRFLCVSADIARAVLAHRVAPERKVSVVHNGIDLGAQPAAGGDPIRDQLGIRPESPVIGTVGRLSEVKRQDVLVRAFAKVRERLPSAHLVIVGDGPLKEALVALVAELNVGDAVHLVGYQPEPRRYFGVMSVFALTSRSEGMPLVVLEAWAAALPVVASNVGGLPDLIRDGETGVLFQSGDVDGLAEKLHHLLTHESDAERLASAGHRHVHERFDSGLMARTYERHYRDLLRAT